MSSDCLHSSTSSLSGEDLPKQHHMNPKDWYNKHIQVQAGCIVEFHPNSSLLCQFKKRKFLQQTPELTKILNTTDAQLKIACRRQFENKNKEEGNKERSKCYVEQGTKKLSQDHQYEITISVYCDTIPGDLKKTLLEWKKAPSRNNTGSSSQLGNDQITSDWRNWRDFRPAGDAFFPDTWKLRFSNKRMDGTDKPYDILAFEVVKNGKAHDMKLRHVVSFHFASAKNALANADFNNYQVLAKQLFKVTEDFFEEFDCMRQEWERKKEYQQFVSDTRRECSAEHRQWQFNCFVCFENFNKPQAVAK